MKPMTNEEKPPVTVCCKCVYMVHKGQICTKCGTITPALDADERGEVKHGTR